VLDTPREVWRAAPTLGQDNEYVFCRLLGLSREELESLQSSGVIS
jgi:crotonobetainyl-CoA:carnitine CoA-transferase CaiB-like acyl-CoA transferase